MQKNHAELLKELKTPEKRRFSFGINVRRFYTDVDGAIIDKNAVAAKYKVKLPVFLFGEFDRLGGYRIANDAMKPPLPSGLVFLTNFINKAPYSTFNIVGFSGFDTVKNQLLHGDIVTVYTDNATAPNIFVWIVQQNTYAAHGSVLRNILSEQQDGHIGKVFVKEILFYAQDDLANSVIPQFNEVWQVAQTDNIGNLDLNQLKPGVYLTPETFQTGFVRMPVTFHLTQYLGLNFYMVFEADILTLNINLKY